MHTMGTEVLDYSGDDFLPVAPAPESLLFHSTRLRGTSSDLSSQEASGNSYVSLLFDFIPGTHLHVIKRSSQLSSSSGSDYFTSADVSVISVHAAIGNADVCDTGKPTSASVFSKLLATSTSSPETCSAFTRSCSYST